jgi:hypothetical protein
MLVIIDIAGVVVSWAFGCLFMQHFLEPKKIAKEAAQRVGEQAADYAKLGHLGTGLQPWVGAIEVLLYSSSIVFGYPQFIAIWFSTKYVASYKTWAQEPIGRTFYNRSLFGSGLNILVDAATGGAILLAVRHVH